MTPARPAGLRHLALGALALCVLAGTLPDAPAFAARIQEGDNVFNGYVMGSPPSRYPGLQKLKAWSTEFFHEVGLYENPAEKTVLNGVPFKKVRYRFADGQLESIELTYEGRESRDKLLAWLEDRYGKLTSAERKILGQVEWHGDGMTITLSYNHTSKQGMVFAASPQLHHRLHESIASMPD